ncbi:MAG: undecaprenyl-phosphate galactose phosphotransferase WbaP [Treponema sp.]|nr:undecaprenyl-phosphate galactose phosphotransferase WbaP [Treponema sp.]
MESNEFNSYLKTNFPRTSSFVSGFSLFIVDFFALLVCIAIGFFIVNLFAIHNINFKSFVNYTVFFPIIFLFFGIFGLYPGIMIPATTEVRNYTFATFLSFTAIVLSVIISDIKAVPLTKLITQGSQNFQLCIAFIIAFLSSVILLPASREFFKYVFCKKSWWGVPCVIYSNTDDFTLITEKLISRKYLGYKPCAILLSDYTDQKEYKGIPVISDKNSEIINCIHKHNIKSAIMYDYKGNTKPIMNLYRYTISVSSEQTSFTSTQQLKDIGGIIGFASTHNLTFKFNIFLKRLLDILIIIASSPLVIPIFLILMLLTKCTSKGPIFYGHVRVGKKGKSFKCWKFRSMNINSQEMLKEILENDPVRREEWERERKFVDDPRVTKFGKFLRKTSMDELPQLFNILIGDMSFVGPRPVTAEEMEKYGEHQDYVLSVLPGLTGMWQISGRSETSYDERIYFDTYYIQNWSIWLDLWILIKSVWVVIKGKGAY